MTRKRRAGPPRVLVTDVSRGSALAVVRSLGRRGWPVIAADHVRDSPGFRSKFAAERVRYPSPLARPEAAAARILDAVRDRGVDLVVPVTDEVILPLRAVREAFDGTRLALASEAALDVVSDKVATVALAERLGIPTPRSMLVERPDQAAAAGATLGWPIVLKPPQSRTRSTNGIARHVVGYAADAADLERAAAAGPVLAQEYVRGEGHGVELLLRDGEVIAAFQHRRLREVPVTGGASSYRESVALDPLLVDHSVRLLRAVDWTGLAMVEFRVAGDGASLMEVNGRIWGSLPLAVRAGIDFPGLMADVHLGRSVSPVPLGRYRSGVRSRSLPLEISWIGAVLARHRPYPALPFPRRSSALAAAAGLLIPFGWDIQSREDPVPGIAEAVRVAVDAAHRLRPRAAHRPAAR